MMAKIVWKIRKLENTLYPNVWIWINHVKDREVIRDWLYYTPFGH